MFEDYNNRAQLLIKYFRGELNAAETEQLDQWLKVPENAAWFEEVKKENWASKQFEGFKPRSSETGFKNLIASIEEKNNSQLPPPYPLKKRPLKKYLLVAAAVGGVAIGVYLAAGNRKTSSHLTANTVDRLHYTPIDLNRPILTLADGSKVNLDESNNKMQETQGAFKTYFTKGKLLYERRPGINEHTPAYNTITTPQGFHQHLVLPDGSKAEIHGESAIRYLLSDTAKIRQVEIRGEVHFEVESNPSRPFIVKTKGIEVMAVGTKFSVRSYPGDDSVIADLKEGKVKIIVRKDTTVLKQGQSATISGQKVTIHTNNGINAGMTDADNMFKFDAADACTVIESIADWHQLEVIYLQKPRKRIALYAPRDTKLSLLQEDLTDYGIFTTVEGKTLKVSNRPITP